MLLCKALEPLYLEGAQAAISDGVYILLGVIVATIQRGAMNVPWMQFAFGNWR